MSSLHDLRLICFLLWYFLRHFSYLFSVDMPHAVLCHLLPVQSGDHCLASACYVVPGTTIIVLERVLIVDRSVQSAYVGSLLNLM
jgi:hypothetical protein